jgi:hypothetical protein
VFVFPDRTVSEIIVKEVGYNELARNDHNEIEKEIVFESQVKINRTFHKEHTPICSALGTACRREACDLFFHGRYNGNLGWGCREFKIDFPTVPFDLRCHIVITGINKPNRFMTIERVIELKDIGARFICSRCWSVYKNKPWKYDSNLNNKVDLCSCGASLFEDILEFIKRMTV